MAFLQALFPTPTALKKLNSEECSASTHGDNEGREAPCIGLEILVHGTFF